METTTIKPGRFKANQTFEAREEYRVALAGYPNTGKSTLFSAITGTESHSANYPGTTVELRSESVQMGKRTFVLYDEPGMVSAKPESEDERISKEFLVEFKPDLVIQLLDARNVRKDLYLTLALLELGYLPILAVNKTDLAKGIDVDAVVRGVGKKLKLPIFLISATNPKSLEGLRRFLESGDLRNLRRRGEPQVHVNYGRIIQEYLEEVERELIKTGMSRADARQRAFDLLDQSVYWEEAGRRRRKRAGERGKAWIRCRKAGARTPAMGKEHQCPKGSPKIPGIGRHVANAWMRSKSEMGVAPLVLVAEARHALIRGLLRGTVTGEPERSSPDYLRAEGGLAGERRNVQETLDRFLLHPFFGLLTFAVSVWFAFQITFAVGFPLADAVSWVFGAVAGAVKGWLVGMPLLASLIGDGIIGGVGAVLSFAPLVFILFFMIALLEDSGYLARGVLLMDGILGKVGLSGRSFIPMFVSFGCNVPGVLATRTIPSLKERIVTMLMLPLMSCSARLPVYLLLIAAFFDRRWAGTALFGIYAVGVMIALLLSLLLRSRASIPRKTFLAIELPIYQLPRLRSAVLSTWRQGKHYLVKAGTIILAVAIVMWALFTFPKSGEFADTQAGNKAMTVENVYDGVDLVARDSAKIAYPSPSPIESTYAGRLGKAIEPVLKPIGFDWKVGVALISAGFAKEVFISTMGVIYSVDSEDEGKLLTEIRTRSGLTPLTAIALMFFILLYMPCLPTSVTLLRELKSARILGMALLTYLAVAYGFAFLTVQVGNLLGIK